MKKTKEGQPSYKKELEIYEKETADKIEVFRLARTNWLANVDDSEDAFAKVKEGVQESNIYKGRSYILRKMRIKTTLLRIHYKAVRPLRYWTFKRKIPEIDMYEETMQIKKVKKLIKREELKEPCSSDRLWTKAAVRECEREAAKIRGKRDRKRAEKECKRIRPSGPCMKAVKRLKDSKRKGLVESCKCEDGREVTVVIKGICLCDKYGLNNFDLHKVCDEYYRSTIPKQSGTSKTDVNPQEKPADKSSGDAEKQAKEGTDKQETEETEKLQNINENDEENELHELNFMDSLEVISNKKSFLGSDIDFEYDKKVIRQMFDADPELKKILKFENEEFLKGDGGRNVGTESEITLYRKLSSREIVKMDEEDAEEEIKRDSSLQDDQKEEKSDEAQNISRSDNLQSNVKNYVEALAEKNKSQAVTPLSLTNLLPGEEVEEEDLKSEKSKRGKQQNPDKSKISSVSREIIGRRLLNPESFQESTKPSEYPRAEQQKKAPPNKDRNKHVTVTPEIKRRNQPKKEILSENMPISISKEIIDSKGLDTEDAEELRKSSKGQQSESLNNLLPEEDEDRSVILKPKRDKYGPRENKVPGKSVLKPVSTDGIIKASNSLEIHKKNLEQKSDMKSEEEVDEKVDENRNPDEKKVVLDNTPTVIPQTKSSRESSATVKHEAKTGATIYSATGKLESHEAKTMMKSLDENVGEEMEPKRMESRRRKSMSRSLLSTRQSKLENKPDEDMSSMVTLYKNTSAEKSEMGLTAEEREKMEEVTNSAEEMAKDEGMIK